MSFTVEDGTGLSNANSYVSVADADTYHTDRGNTTWTSETTANKQAALIDATTYIDSSFQFVANNAPRDPLTGFGGPLVSSDQALAWPRVNAIDQEGRELDGVPKRVKDATAELALTALSEDLLPTQNRITKREKVGTLEVEYSDSSPANKRFPLITRMLRHLTVGSGVSHRVMRV